MITPNTLLQNRYLVIEQIGHGGMGAVYRATDQRFGSTVALKETFFDDPNLRKAFEREAHLLNRLRHPALPRVSDHFTDEQGQFLVMEFIEGADLSELLEKNGEPFPLEQVLGWADQLLDALDYLHTHEPPVIHRDIKPQNLKLASRNQIVLLDFGLAKGTPGALSRASLTGSVFGYSRNYAPLEQMQGTGTDPRSDLYSLAATLYHLLTNTAPPDALTRAMATVNSHDDPLRPAHEVHAQVTPSVSAVISKAMQQSAAQRFQTAEAMRAALRDAARKVHEERDATIVMTPAPATNLGPTNEHETRLMSAQTTPMQTSGGGATRPIEHPQTSAAAHADAGRQTNIAHGSEAATLLAGTSAATHAAHASRPAAPRDDASVVTRVSVPHDNAPSRRKFSPAALSALAAVVILVVATGAYFAYTNRRAEPRQAPPPQRQPAQEAALPTPEPQPTAQTNVEVAQPTPPTVATPDAPAQAKQSAPNKTTKRTEVKANADGTTSVTVDGETVVVERPQIPEPPEPLDAEEMRMLSPEEREALRRVPRRIRRMIMEQKRERMRRQMEAERLRRERPLYPRTPPNTPE